jgi:hypothetical protein
VVVVVV